MYSIKNNRLYDGKSAVQFVKSPYVGDREMGTTFSETPKILVMHFTYGASAKSSAEWFKDPRNEGSSAHIVVDRDGSVIQCVPFDTIAWHAGKSRHLNRAGHDLVGLNKYSIGIELANWGYLQQAGDTWTSHTRVKINKPIIAVHKNGNPPDRPATAIGWESYPAVQFETAANIARLLVSELGINEIIGHDEISRGRKWDPGPAFDFMHFRGLVFGGRGSNGDIRLRVNVSEGLNLRSGPGIDYEVLKLLAEGTVVETISENGFWMMVTVFDGTGKPIATGWVHSKYLAPV